ncbi:MAG: redox-regulated ATPase YchF [Candidatus Yanofskybacteria bacterium RIFCSPHIGHO2_01_FULL_44_17]|uniref:Redox-regulated ATPase YchF n=1 Tax=Candidatus Yanofskybacteria bacterium RIFCSPHIGHO2_01_FULL_44_17 TaxID=1802668 RepID=A0A1F8ES43_9BACT|nr:MAG: redox-regulated ATPase YchF [Candidatus Yanofskybacteria bacterium RIFCSPHIGHO2_01_FULL_44_17]
MLSIGIVGLPNVGKSTLFKALTKKQVDIQNYPFTTIDPNVGVVGVPDERLGLLAKMSNSAKIIPTAIEFIDIAGLVKGAAQGEGLGNKFLANIREVGAIAEVVRIFEDDKITHVHKKIDPADDVEAINMELMLADLETINKRIDKTKVNDPSVAVETSALRKLKIGLESGMLAINIELADKEEEVARELNLLTNKKFIYILNASENQLKSGWQPDEKLKKTIGDSDFVILTSTFELLLSESSADEQKVFLEEVNLTESRLDALIKKAYHTLGLTTFLTTGEDETRAWTCKADATAPQAARAIHTDFEQKFIRAEVINWKTLLDIGGYASARAKGLIKTVGRDYVVQDGDVIEIKI